MLAVSATSGTSHLCLTIPHNTLQYLTPPHTTLQYLTPSHTTSQYLTPPHITSQYLTPPHITSQYLTIPHNTSQYLTIPLDVTTHHSVRVLKRCTLLAIFMSHRLFHTATKFNLFTFLTLLLPAARWTVTTDRDRKVQRHCPLWYHPD